MKNLKPKKSNKRELFDLLNQGRLHNTQAEYKKALRCFEFLIANGAENVFEDKTKIRLYDSYAVALFYDKQYEKAADYFSRAINLGDQLLDKTNLIRNLSNRSVCYSYINNDTAAIEDCLRVEREEPGNKEIFNIHGDVLFRMMEFKQAKKKYDQSVKLKNPFGYFSRGECLSVIGEYEAAISDFLKVIENEKETKSINYYSTCYGLAYAYWKLGKSEESKLYIGFLKLGVEKERRAIRALIYPLLAKVFIYIEMNFDAAMAAFDNFFANKEKLKKSSDENAPIIATLETQQLIKKNKELARQLQELKDVSKEVEQMLITLTDPHYLAQIHLHKAVAYNRNNDHRAALVALTVALTLCKNTWFTIEDLAAAIKIYLNAKKFAEAKEYCDRAIDKSFNGKLYNFYFYKAIACFGLKQMDEALQNFFDAIKLTPILLADEQVASFIKTRRWFEINEVLYNSKESSILTATLEYLNLKILLPPLAPNLYEVYKSRSAAVNERTPNLRPRSNSAPAVPYFFSSKSQAEKIVSKTVESENGKEEIFSDKNLSNN